MIINQKFAKELAISLLEINAVILRPHTPFRWTSGWNSPIYCDNRLTLRHPELRTAIADQFTAFIRETYPDVDVIAGTSTAGIPHAAWIADRMNKPMAYVRSKPKQHGTTNQIEGGIQKGEKAVIVEDLISTGESAISVAKALEFIGVEVLGIVSIFNYGFALAHSRFEERGLNIHSLTNYDTLLEAGVKFGFVAQKDLELLTAWRKNPETWPKGF
ncbi:MAG: orotate phosphoribosyltransferase [Balneolales bacterium]|nr:orotate phosphoribosyltransferase [Balneolales bacterium]